MVAYRDGRAAFSEQAIVERIGAKIEEVEASHVPFLTQPKAIADVIDRAAQGARASDFHVSPYPAAWK